MALTPLSYFVDIVSKVESFEIFHKSLEPLATTPMAFTATTQGRGPIPGHSSSNYSNQNAHLHFGHHEATPRVVIQTLATSCLPAAHPATKYVVLR